MGCFRPLSEAIKCFWNHFIQIQTPLGGCCHGRHRQPYWEQLASSVSGTETLQLAHSWRPDMNPQPFDHQFTIHSTNWVSAPNDGTKSILLLCIVMLHYNMIIPTINNAIDLFGTLQDTQRSLHQSLCHSAVKNSYFKHFTQTLFLKTEDSLPVVTSWPRLSS